MTRTITLAATALLALSASLSAGAVSDKMRAEIEQRIKPVGGICLEGDSSCGGPALHRHHRIEA